MEPLDSPGAAILIRARGVRNNIDWGLLHVRVLIPEVQPNHLGYVQRDRRSLVHDSNDLLFLQQQCGECGILLEPSNDGEYHRDVSPPRVSEMALGLRKDKRELVCV